MGNQTPYKVDPNWELCQSHPLQQILDSRVPRLGASHDPQEPCKLGFYTRSRVYIQLLKVCSHMVLRVLLEVVLRMNSDEVLDWIHFASTTSSAKWEQTFRGTT